MAIKLLKATNPTPRQIDKLENEYRISQRLSDVHSIRKVFRRDKSESKLALIMEYVPGVTIKEYTYDHGWTLKNFLNVTIKIVDALSHLHAHRIIHRDFNSNNIIYDPESHNIWLIDLELAQHNPAQEALSIPRGSTVPAYGQQEAQKLTLTGTLSYISPEQTGRTNQALDFRTDLYSLGITLYEMLTASLPFEFDEEMELIHAHLAVKPEPPNLRRNNTLDQDIPQVISEMILKLLSKSPEDRYQSAISLKADLLTCLTYLNEGQDIPNFNLDSGGKTLDLSEKLYEREEESALLLESFERVKTGSFQLSLISGYSGTGKTTLIQSIEEYVSENKANIICGKFDPMQQQMPYAGWIQAFSELVQDLLTSDPYQLEYWKQIILDAIGENGKVLSSIIPDLELIIGTKVEESDISGKDGLNRFHFLLTNFIQALAQPSHPLIIFLDDFHWADNASIDLFHSLIADTSNSHLWIIIAYRDEDLQEAFPLKDRLEALASDSQQINIIHLENLSLSKVNELITDSLQSELEETLELSKVVFEKTQGNPFFVKQTLRSIFEQGYLYHALGPNTENKSDWVWNLPAIRQLNITDNVVDYMAAKIQQLPEVTRQLLEKAACVGDLFEIRILSGISEMAKEAINGSLQPAIDEGLIVALDQGEAFYKFTHDRIRRAVYSLIPEELTAKLHHKIGNLMMEPFDSWTFADIPTDKVYAIVSQWNNSISELAERTERNRAAELNLIAGKKANLSGAFPSAMLHLKTGIELLAQYGWQNTYRLNLALHNEAAEAAFLSGDLELMDQMVDKILHQTVTVMDKVRAYEIKLQSYISQQRLTEAVQLGLKILTQLGIDLPDTPKDLQVWWRMFRLRRILKRKDPHEFIDFSYMEDPKLLAAMQVMSNISSIVQIIKPKLTPLIICRQLQLTLKYGASPYSAGALIGYGLILNLTQGKIDEGFEYGEVGMKLIEKFEDRRYQTSLYHSFYGLLYSYKEHVKDAQSYLKEGYLLGLETGDFSSATFCIVQYLYNAFMLGEDLKKLSEELNTYFNALSQAKQEVGLAYLSLIKQLIQGFTSYQYHFAQLEATENQDRQLIDQFDSSNDIQGMINLNLLKLILSYHYENYELGISASKIMEEYNASITNIEIDPNYSFYYCLLHLAACPDLKMLDQKIALRRVEEHQKYLRSRSDYAPQNFLHKYFLVEAEKLRILGKEEEARPYYEKALDLARNYDHLKDESLAWELAGKFYRARGQQFLAEMHLQQAVKAYQRWNAEGIVEHLMHRYPRYISQQNLAESGDKKSSKGSSTSSSKDTLTNLDLHSITKASQALSGEVVLSNLLNKMMQIVIENAGASRGIFLENRSGTMHVLAEGDVNEGVSVHISPNVTNINAFPSLIINYTLRTKKVLVLDYPLEDNTFSRDPYIEKVQPASVLCFPILHKNQLRALIYLENSLTPSAFNKERIEILDILSSQIAISIENARLYENLDEKVKERTRQLDEKNQQLGQTIHQLEKAHSQLKSAQSQLVQREKMASLGQLTNGMAHEINNPVNFITGNIRPLQRNINEVKVLLEKVKKLPKAQNMPKALEDIMDYREEIDADFLVEEIDMLVEGIQDGAQRTQAIVSGLKSFTRPDEETFKLVDIHEGLDSTLTLLGHEINPAIVVKKDYGIVSLVEGIPGKLNQIFMNVLNNAIYAIKVKMVKLNGTSEETLEAPHIIIKTEEIEHKICIIIKDRGVGMSESVRQRVFDPFFTTKDVGEGTGLGMAIVYGTIEQHNGDIQITSKEGIGTEIKIILPKNQP